MLDAKLYTIDQNLPQLALAAYKKLPEESSTCLLIPRDEFLNKLSEIEELFNISINSRHIKDAMNKEHPSFFDSTGDYEMIILRTIHDIQSTDDAYPVLKYTASSFTFFCFSHLLIIVHDNQYSLLDKFNQAVLNNNKITIKSSLELLYFSLNFLLDQFLLIRTPASKQFKFWQKLMLEDPSNFNLWNELINYKSGIENIDAFCEDIDDTFEEWRRYTRYQLEQQFIINLNDLDEHNERAMTVIEKLSANIDSLIQLHFSALSNRNNEILRVLAIISAIFLPLMLITGIFGMNFINMPILQERYAYHLTVGCMIMVALVLIVVFRIKKWL